MDVDAPVAGSSSGVPNTRQGPGIAKATVHHDTVRVLRKLNEVQDTVNAVYDMVHWLMEREWQRTAVSQYQLDRGRQLRSNMCVPDYDLTSEEDEDDDKEDKEGKKKEEKKEEKGKKPVKGSKGK